MKDGTVIPNKQLIDLVEKLHAGQNQEADA